MCVEGHSKWEWQGNRCTTDGPVRNSGRLSRGRAPVPVQSALAAKRRRDKFKACPLDTLNQTSPSTRASREAVRPHTIQGNSCRLKRHVDDPLSRVC